MRNRISCSAQTLGQLEPQMILSVVGDQVYKLGNEYFSENRVQVLEADPTQISAEVNGTFGVYSQTIKLRGGTLSTKCSCPSTEQPFCRHCVAVLLQHHHEDVAEKVDAPVTEEAAPSESVGQAPPVNQAQASMPSSDFNFRDVTTFIDWVQGAVGAMNNGGSLPSIPALGPGGVKTWAEAIESIYQRFLQSEEERVETQTDLRSAETKITELTDDLEQSRREARDTQGACVGLQKEIEKYQELLADLSKVSKERDGLGEQINGMRDELKKKCAELDSLSVSLSGVSKSIQNTLPPRHSS